MYFKPACLSVFLAVSIETYFFDVTFQFQFKSTKNKILPEQTWLVIKTSAFRAQALQTSNLDNFKDASSDKIQVKTQTFSL